MEPPASDPVGPTDATHTVAEVMRPAVTMVETTSHLAAAAYLMNRANQSALVVVDDAERPVAIIAEADLMRAVAHGADTSQDRIVEWMNRDPQPRELACGICPGSQAGGQVAQGRGGHIDAGRVDKHPEAPGRTGDLGHEPVYQELLHVRTPTPPQPPDPPQVGKAR
jgi:CBS domain protein